MTLSQHLWSRKPFVRAAETIAGDPGVRRRARRMQPGAEYEVQSDTEATARVIAEHGLIEGRRQHSGV